MDGNRIGEFRAEENRRPVGEEDLSEYLSQAVVLSRTGGSTSTGGGLRQNLASCVGGSADARYEPGGIDSHRAAYEKPCTYPRSGAARSRPGAGSWVASLVKTTTLPYRGHIGKSTYFSKGGTYLLPLFTKLPRRDLGHRLCSTGSVCPIGVYLTQRAGAFTSRFRLSS